MTYYTIKDTATNRYIITCDGLSDTHIELVKLILSIMPDYKKEQLEKEKIFE